MGCPVVCSSGLTLRRIADLQPGGAGADARDAFATADAARVMPHTSRSVDLADETIAELEMPLGFVTIRSAKPTGSATGCAGCSPTPKRLVENIFTALDEQAVTVPGTNAAALADPSLADSLTSVLDQRKLLTDQSVLRPKPLTSCLNPLVVIGREQLKKRFVQRSSDSVDRRPHYSWRGR